jgi:putative ABC transport system permease protein
LILKGDEIGEPVSLLGPPPDSALIEPILISGRWLLPDDQNAIVLNERFLSRFPDLQPGDPLRLRVNGEEVDWVVVGFFQFAGKSAGYLGYVPYETLSELIHLPQKAITYRVVARRPDLTLPEQEELGRALESYLRGKGYRITEVEVGLSLRQTASEGLNILTAFLLIMAVLTALVGSIGLAGTMSMNVLERTREIGIMRAIGATNPILLKLVIAEGMMIGLVSWVLAVGASLPITKVMSDTINVSLFDAPSNFSYTPIGPMIWLALVLVLSVLASALPARSATRLTIREVLAYE